MKSGLTDKLMREIEQDLASESKLDAACHYDKHVRTLLEEINRLRSGITPDHPTKKKRPIKKA